ncbi:acyl carrier protein, chloroplastic-like [Cornus florida]|uniref:acyl carrier protein, chloroplastic-like n=1 Tax=Cornus florida TaxID=4283 RepID=UPI0028A1AABD|nr:acyl carrier protein, chloroplastic-like [Cornus florida]
MASILLASVAPTATLTCTPRPKCALNQLSSSFSTIGGLRVVPRIQIKNTARKSLPLNRCHKITISCSSAQAETLTIVQSTIAKQLSVDESTVTPQTKFVDLGADSLDTVEIMMALEEKFEVSIGEEGAANIATVQDAADLIEKVKAAAA